MRSHRDGPRACHNAEVSEKERGRQVPYDIAYIRNVKYGAHELICRTEADVESRLVVLPKRVGWGREGELGVWHWQTQLLYIETDKQQCPIVGQ